MTAIDRLVDDVMAAAAGEAPFGVGTVETVTAGTPPTVTVTYKGAVVSARWPKDSSYTPQVGDVVLMARFGSQRLILRAY